MATTVAAASTVARAGREAGTHCFTASSAETCHGSNTCTCDMTRSLKRGDGAKCGRCSSAPTICLASASSARQAAQLSTCACSGATPKPASPSSN
jgi:hypothetical protein